MRRGLILMILAMVLAVTSCTKENEVGKTTEPQIGNKDLQAQFEAWKKNRENLDIKVKPPTLKELNEALIQSGLDPLSATDLQISDSDYQLLLAGQRIPKPANLEARTYACYPDPWYEFLCDMNGNGYSDSGDGVLARKVILEYDPPSNESENYGTLSYYLESYDPLLSTYDIAVMNYYWMQYYCNW